MSSSDEVRLTATQRKALDFIRQTQRISGMAPTLRELCEYMEYSAIGSAQDLVAALRKKGLLAEPRRKGSARQLVLAEVNEAEDTDGIDPDSLYVPCLGSVPAGLPLEAVEQRVGTLRISSAFFRRPSPKAERLFALRAKGLSMVMAGILDGDWLVAEICEEASPGDIVIARLDGEATVKRLMRDRDGWYLQPENPDFESIRPIGGQVLEILGRVVALQRLLA